MAPSSIQDLLSSPPLDLKPYEELYKHFHANPELSHLEEKTAATIASHLKNLNSYEIHTAIGSHGLVAILRNGPGKTILLRADIDALPVKEATGLPYASTKKMVDINGVDQHVMHACGHDMHITCLLATADFLSAHKSSWSGTLILVFQPEEERGTGAKAMVDGGLYDRVPVPDFILAQHVTSLPTGHIGSKKGTIMAAADSFKIVLYGRGGHGSMPHMTIDPVIMATNLIQRLQGIVSRETDPSDMAVVTVGSLVVGQTENIISDKAEIGLDVRSVRKETREKILESVRRMVKAEYIGSGATKEPTIIQTRTFPTTDNDEGLADTLAQAFREQFGDRFDADTPRINASEDVTILASSQGKPSLFWFFGGTDLELYQKAEKEGRIYEDVPGNHSPFFAPVLQPTLKTGFEALCVAALTFLTLK
jgi:amidohydrolase